MTRLLAVLLVFLGARAVDGDGPHGGGSPRDRVATPADTCGAPDATSMTACGGAAGADASSPTPDALGE